MDPRQEFIRNITRRHFFSRGTNLLGGAALASLLGPSLGSSAARGATLNSSESALPASTTLTGRCALLSPEK